MNKPLLIVCIGESSIPPEDLSKIGESFKKLEDNFNVVIYNNPKADTSITFIGDENIKIIKL